MFFNSLPVPKIRYIWQNVVVSYLNLTAKISTKNLINIEIAEDNVAARLNSPDNEIQHLESSTHDLPENFPQFHIIATYSDDINPIIVFKVNTHKSALIIQKAIFNSMGMSSGRAIKGLIPWFIVFIFLAFAFSSGKSSSGAVNTSPYISSSPSSSLNSNDTESSQQLDVEKKLAAKMKMLELISGKSLDPEPYTFEPKNLTPPVVPSIDLKCAQKIEPQLTKIPSSP